MTTTSPPGAGSAGGTPPTDQAQSVDLWKFFEERGAKLMESMFSVVTWIVGFAAVVLGFVLKEGFAEGSGFTRVTHPGLVVVSGLAGLLILAYAAIVVLDYGKHINRTFGRADAARGGESSPEKIWKAGNEADAMSLPPICGYLLGVLLLFAVVFVALIGGVLCPAFH